MKDHTLFHVGIIHVAIIYKPVSINHIIAPDSFLLGRISRVNDVAPGSLA